MDQEELEKDRKVKEDIRNNERQHAGIDRHFRGPDGFGWFYLDPDSIAPHKLQSGRYKIKEVTDLSNVETFVEDKKHKLAPGSFSIGVDYDVPGLRGGIFTFSHPEDIEEFLQKAGVEQPKELIGREMTQYWIGRDKEPGVADRIVGVDLPEYSILLSELIKRGQGK